MLLALVTSVVATACPSPNEEGCGNPSEDLYARIKEAIPEEGTLRNPKTYDAKGSTFISVEHRTPEEVKDDDSGDILTFVVASDDSTQIFAVDERARKESTFDDAELDVREKGAVESRGCVYNARREKTTTTER